MEKSSRGLEIPEIVSGTVPSLSYFGELTTYTDARGALTELYRQEWPNAPALPQWNLLRNAPNCMRGMHLHLLHSDFIVVIEGEMLLALRDIRKGGSGSAGIVRLTGQRLCWAFIPPGVIHGFYSTSGNTVVCGLSEAWNSADDLSCRWDDPDLDIAWPSITDPVISPRDGEAGGFWEMVATWEASRAQ